MNPALLDNYGSCLPLVIEGEPEELISVRGFALAELELRPDRQPLLQRADRRAEGRNMFFAQLYHGYGKHVARTLPELEARIATFVDEYKLRSGDATVELAR